MSRTLQCPRPDCSGKLPYVNAKTNSDRSVRVWRRRCPVCGAQVTDTGVFSREIRLPEGEAEHDPGAFLRAEKVCDHRIPAR